MHKVLVAGLLSLVVSGCGASSASPPVPTTDAPTPAPTVGLTEPPAASDAPTGPPTDVPATDVPATDVPATDVPSPSPAAWRERTDVGSGPSAREDHTWTVADDGSAAYLFGGRGPGGASSELWRFDLASDMWTSLTPSGESPAARFGHTAIWASGIGLVIWSGQAGSDFFADLWAYDVAANAWSELPGEDSGPPARYGSCAALAADGRMWISHGFTSSGRFSDTWAYDFEAGQWQDVTPGDQVPVERCLHDCFVSAAGDFVLYGGQTTGAPALGDIWTYDAASTTWTKGPGPAAPPRQLYALTRDESGTAFVWGGGSLERGYLDDAWLVDSVNLDFTPVEQPEHAPAARSGATLITDPDSARMLLFGGVNDDGPLGDLWELTGTL